MIAPLLFLLVGMLAAGSSNNIQARRHAVRQLAKEVAAERNELQLEVEKNNWSDKERKFRRTLVDHHPHRGRRLQPEETEQCMEHFGRTEREVRLSIIGHILYDMRSNVPKHFEQLIVEWNSRARPMYDWSRGSMWNGELKLLAHECVRTVLMSEDGAKKLWNMLDRLERDYVSGQWKGFFFLSGGDEVVKPGSEL
jgi:hypothetical protein